MKCLECGSKLSSEFFALRTESPEFKGGRFACPHCGAEHLRRLVGHLPSGEPLYSLRLWGHLTAARRSASPGTPKGNDRRQGPRTKPWR